MATYSKNAVTFLNRTTQFNADIELIDIVCTAVKEGSLHDDATGKIFLHLSDSKHKTLKKRKVSPHNRTLAAFHLRQTVYGSYIKDIYEELTAYLKGLLFEASVNLKVESGRIIGENKITFNAKDLLKLTTREEMVETIIDSLFQSLEAEQSTIKLIDKICRKLGLEIEVDVKGQALPYLEIRHKLVHTGGKVDRMFREKYPMLSYTHRGYIDMKYTTISKAKRSIVSLVKELDRIAIEARIIKPNVQNED